MSTRRCVARAIVPGGWWTRPEVPESSECCHAVTPRTLQLRCRHEPSLIHGHRRRAALLLVAAVSAWGMVVLALLITTAASVVLTRRRAAGGVA